MEVMEGRKKRRKVGKTGRKVKKKQGVISISIMFCVCVCVELILDVNIFVELIKLKYSFAQLDVWNNMACCWAYRQDASNKL